MKRGPDKQARKKRDFEEEKRRRDAKADEEKRARKEQFFIPQNAYKQLKVFFKHDAIPCTYNLAFINSSKQV